MVRKSQGNGRSGGIAFAEDQPKTDKKTANNMLGDRPVLKVAVEFQGVSFGKTTAAVGIKIVRGKLRDEQINQFFVNCRMDITMAVDPEADKDDPAQETLIDTASVKLNSVADVHRVSIGADDMTARLSFSKESVQASDLARFSNQSGFIIVAKVGEAGTPPAGEAAVGGDDGQGELSDDE